MVKHNHQLISRAQWLIIAWLHWKRTYSDSKADIINNGHTVQFNYDGGSTLTFNGKEFELLQFHFHADSEHTVGGTQFPLEVHLVHSNPDGSLAVIGIFFEEGDENALLAAYFDNIPEHEDDHYADSGTFNVGDILPSNMSYYHYTGSLTTPPCSEIVNWIVIKSLHYSVTGTTG